MRALTAKTRRHCRCRRSGPSATAGRTSFGRIRLFRLSLPFRSPMDPRRLLHQAAILIVVAKILVDVRHRYAGRSLREAKSLPVGGVKTKPLSLSSLASGNNEITALVYARIFREASGNQLQILL